MDNIPEREQPKQERIVSLGEEFKPFQLDRTEIIKRKIGYDFNSLLKLNIKDGLQFDFRFLSMSDRGLKAMGITPFDPELGYQIDSDDLTLDTRIKKFRNLMDTGDYIDFSKASNVIVVMHLLSRDDIPISHSMLDLLKKLRLYVFFPTSRYESKYWDNYLEPSTDAKGPWLSHFYPLDTGPLPTDIIQPYMNSGLKLYVPADLEKLSQIRARFVLAEEQPEEAQA